MQMESKQYSAHDETLQQEQHKNRSLSVRYTLAHGLSLVSSREDFVSADVNGRRVTGTRANGQVSWYAWVTGLWVTCLWLSVVVEGPSVGTWRLMTSGVPSVRSEGSVICTRNCVVAGLDGERLVHLVTSTEVRLRCHGSGGWDGMVSCLGHPVWGDQVTGVVWGAARSRRWCVGCRDYGRSKLCWR